MIITYNITSINNLQPQNLNRSGLFDLQNKNTIKPLPYKNIHCNGSDIFFKSSAGAVHKEAKSLKRHLYGEKLARIKSSLNKKINTCLEKDKKLENKGINKDYKAKLELLETVHDNTYAANPNHGLEFIPKANKIFCIGNKIESDKTLKKILLLASYDESGRVRAITYKLLGSKFSSDEKIYAILLKRLKTDNCKLAKTALIKTLGKDFKPDEKLKKALKEIFIMNTSVRVRVAATKVLGENYSSDKEVKDLLLEFFKDYKLTRLKWFIALGKKSISAEETGKILSEKPKHIARIKVVVAKVLGKYFNSDEEVRKTLSHASEHDNNELVRTASALYLNKNVIKAAV